MHGGPSLKELAVFLCLICALVVGTAASGAQQGAKLDLKTSVVKEIEVRKDGKVITERIFVDRADPQDLLVYTITYHNPGGIAAVDAQIIDPIPEGVVYLAGSAEGQDAEINFSIDKGRTWRKAPIMTQVKRADGTMEGKPVPTERYTHIRWIIKKPVQPGQSGRVSFKATVK